MRKNSRELVAPETCPVCGEDVPRSALACPECGADHRSGWRENADIYDGVDLGDGAFDYNAFVQEEFGKGVKSAHIKRIWWITATLLVMVFLALYFYGR